MARDDDDSVRALFRQGYDDEEIAAYCDCSPRTVARIRARLGLVRREPGRGSKWLGPWRIAPEERDEITAAAKRAGLTVSAWARGVLLEAARK